MDLKHVKDAGVIIAKACAFPLLNKHPVVLLLCSTMLAPLASHLFPTAEEALEKEGLSQTIAQELAPGEKIRVEKGLAAVLLTAPVLVPFNLLAYASPNAYAMKSDSLINMSGNCTVNMNVFDSFSPEEYISAATDISTKEIKNSPLSKKEGYIETLLHEMRHCSKDNTGSGIEREGDAEYYGATIAARELKNPEIIRFAFNLYAAQAPNSDGHDMSLYLDAKFNNLSIPSTDQIEEANKVAGKFIEEKGTDLSSLLPLARKRVEFYKEAQSYFRNPPQKKEAPKSFSGPKIS